MALDVTTEEYTEVMASAKDAIDDLTNQLSNVSVNIGKNSTDILTAIKHIFGPNYINTNGTSTITYEMYDKVTKSLRTAGKLKVGEYL